MDGLLKTVNEIENEYEFSVKKLFVPLTTAKVNMDGDYWLYLTQEV